MNIKIKFKLKKNMGNKQSFENLVKTNKLNCLTIHDEKGKLLVKNNNGARKLFVTKDKIVFPNNNWIPKKSLVMLFVGNTYGIGSTNEYSFQLIFDYNESHNYIKLSKLWYMINQNKIISVENL